MILTKKELKLKNILTLLLILIFFTACEKKHHTTTQAETKKEPVQTIYELQDQNKTIQIILDDNSFKIKSPKKLALLLFYTSWCPGCKAELEELKKIDQKFRENLDIIALQLDQGKSEVPFFHSLDSTKNNKIADKIYAILHLPSSKPIPVMILLKNGEYVIHYVGATPIEMVEMDIKKSLGE